MEKLTHFLLLCICDYHRSSFENNDVVGFSVSINASKVASVVQMNSRYKHIVGGAAENHFIRLPEDDNDDDRKTMQTIFDKFANNTYSTVSEVRLATISYQWTNNGKTRFLQFMSWPQTKNQNSNFYYEVVHGAELAEACLRKEGYTVSLMCTAYDGVSCDNIWYC